MMTEQERRKIEADARWEEKVENRLDHVDGRIDSIEGSFKLIRMVILAAAGTILTQIWEPLKAVIFRGN